MEQIATLARWGALGFIAALAAIVFLKILVGSISLNGLLTGDRGNGTEYFSVGRTQLLLSTVIAAVSYLRQVASAPSLTSLPDISANTLAMLGGSQLLYLVGKGRALWFGPAAVTSQKGKDQ